MENPKIRFKGFTKDWEQRKLNEVGVVIDPHPSHRAPKEEQGGIPFIGIGDVDEMGNINRESARPVPENVYDEHHKRYDLNVPSLGLGRVASLGKVIRLRSDIGKYAISPTISVLQFSENINIDYLYAYMNTPQFKKQFEGKSNGSTRQSVGTEMVRLLNLSMPFNLDEQKAIGTFYKNLDNLITLHQRKCEQTKNLKKYMLQKMFPQNGAKVPEIRFDGFTYDWEQRKLGEVCSRVQGNDGRMDLPTLTISAANGWMNQEDRFSGNIAGKEQENYTLLHKGELSYNHGNSKLAKYGTVFSLQSYKEALVPRVYHSFKVEEGSPDFLEYYFATKLPDRELGKLISSGARMDGLLNIGYNEFMGIQMLFPSVEEQKQISNYFRNLDHLITLHQRKCDELKKMKKYMLQNMFI